MRKVFGEPLAEMCKSLLELGAGGTGTGLRLSTRGV